ncbi:MAG: outer membrane beta-barrel protein [Bacteroidota bacterium]
MQAIFRFRLFVLLLLSCCISAPVFSQIEEKGSTIRVGVGLTGYAYRGDLTQDDPSFWRVYPGGNISLQFSPRRKFQPQLNAGFGRVIEQWDSSLPIDPTQAGANSFFSTNFFYFDFRVAYLPFRQWRLQPYLVAGGGLLFFNPLDQNGNFLIDNIFTREAGEIFNTTAFVLPVGTGLRFHINQLAYVGLEYIYRSSVTDYIDNIGARGLRSGPDRLHNLMVSLNFTLQGSPVEVKEIAPLPKEDPPALIVQSESEIPEKLTPVATPDEEAERKRKLRALATLEWSHLPPVTSPFRLYKGDQVHYQVGPHGLSPAEMAYYQQLVHVALTHDWTLFLTIETPNSLSEIALQHHTNYMTLLKLNPELEELLDGGTIVRVPDLVRAADYERQTTSGK